MPVGIFLLFIANNSSDMSIIFFERLPGKVYNFFSFILFYFFLSMCIAISVKCRARLLSALRSKKKGFISEWGWQPQHTTVLLYFLTLTVRESI